ncbi:MAG: hypothetical protein JXB35_10485 [Anaerolineae bacterium]|nr:hypothetical protein [Anaerolineae bacterium]
MGTSPQFVTTPNVGAQTIENSDGTTVLDVLTAGSSGTRIGQLFAVHNDSTAAVLVLLWLHDGSESHLVGQISMPAATSSDVHVTGDFLQSSTWAGVDGGLIIPSGWKLQAGLNTTLTSGKKCSVIAAGGDF